MKTQQVSTGGLIVRDDRKFLIVQRSPQEEFMPGNWELPGGGSEYGETPQEAMRRELKEELNLDVTVRVPLTTAQYFMQDIQRVEIIFLCTLPYKGQDVRLTKEHSTFAWVSRDELSKYKFDSFMEKILKEVMADFEYWTEKYLGTAQ